MVVVVVDMLVVEMMVLVHTEAAILVGEAMEEVARARAATEAMMAVATGAVAQRLVHLAGLGVAEKTVVEWQVVTRVLQQVAMLAVTMEGGGLVTVEAMMVAVKRMAVATDKELRARARTMATMTVAVGVVALQSAELVGNVATEGEEKAEVSEAHLVTSAVEEEEV